jgi:hypothetical protein
VEEMFEENLSLQTETNKNSKFEEKIKRINLRKLHVQIKLWKPHNENSLCLVFLC